MRRWLAGLSAAAVMAAPAAALAQAGGPVARIAAYNAAILRIERADGGAARRADAFGPVVRDFYDMPAVAGLVVGPTWSTMSAGDKAMIEKALTRHSAVSLARSFTADDGTKFETAPAAVSRGETQLVTVKIGTDAIIYRLRQSGGTWKIIDAQAGGVSQLAIQRADLASTLASGGAAGLVKRLDQLDAVK